MLNRIVRGARLLSSLLLVLYSTTVHADSLRLATTTSTYNSGLLDAILPAFQQQTGTEVQVIAVGTGAALRMGRDGDADVLLVHAPDAEQQFIEQGYGVKRVGVMYNDFVIVGPAHDPAGIAAAAFSRWLVSAATQQQIADFRINGKPLFVPSALKPVAQTGVSDTEQSHGMTE